MKSECILIRVGEQSLKSEQVMRIFDRILIRNIKASLKGIDYELKRERNRFFIFTKDIEKSIERLKKVFGITSMSPCYVSGATIEDMKNVAKKIFKPKGTFAIRARRTGGHKFTSQDIGQEVGYIIDAKADLGNPENELFIECRQKEAYLFFEKILGPGGLPLGSGGKVLGIMKDEQDLAACWLMARRGLEIRAITSKKALLDKFKKWYIGPELKTYDKTPKEHDCDGIVFGEKTWASLKKQPEILVLRPLVGFNENKIKDILTQISE